MIWKILILSVVSGILYRLGGKGGFKNAKLIRRIGVPLVALLALKVLGFALAWWVWILTFGLMFFAMTTYFSTVFDPDDNVEWPEWALVGLLYGISLFFVANYTGYWFGWGIRTATLGIVICLWSQAIGWDDLEEFGRGFLFIISLPILLIG